MGNKFWKIAGIFAALAVITGAVYIAIANYELIIEYLGNLKEKLEKKCPIKLSCCSGKSDLEDDFDDFDDMELSGE